MRTMLLGKMTVLAMAVLALSFAFLVEAGATVLTWDADNVTPGIQNGGGTWTNGTNFWQNGGVNMNWNNSNPDSAIFGAAGGSPGTVNLGGPITAGGITFNTISGYIVVGDTITLTGTSILAANSNGTINSALAGSTGMTKNGAGMLTLGGLNTYSGTTLINAGVLNIQSNSALGSTTGGTTVANGAALQLQNNITVTGETLTLRGQGVGGVNGSLRNISGNNEWAGNILADYASPVSATSSPADVTRIGSDAGNLLISGNILVSAGSPFPGSAVSVGVQGNGTGEISGNISGGTAGVQTFFRSSNGSGMWTISGTNTYLGYTAINGPITLQGGSAIPDTSLVAVNAATGAITLASSETFGSLVSLNAATAATTITLGSNTLTVGADNTTPVDPFGNGANGAYWGVISGAGNLTKTGTGKLTLTGVNTYTGATTINDGILQIGVGSTTGSISSTSNITIGATGTLIHSRSTAATLNNAISGDGNLIKNGAGTLTMGGATGNTYTGMTTVNGGTLDLSKTSGNAVGGDLTIQNGAKLLYGGGTVARSNQIADSSNVVMSGATSEFNYAPLSNNFGIVETIASLNVTGGKFASGALSNWTVTGAASFTGGAGATTFVGNSSSRQTYGSLTLVDMSSATGEGNPANAFTLYGNSSANQSSITVGSGGLTLNNSNLFIRRGTAAGTLGSKLVLNGNVTTLGSAASSISKDPTAPSLNVGTHAVELSGTAGAASRTFTIGGGGADLEISVPITNGAATPGSLVKEGLGTLNLTGINNYTGTTTVNAGRLLVSGSTSAASAVTIGANGILGGTGTISGATNILGTHAPGSSAGVQTFNGNLTYAGGASVVQWELTDNTTTNSPNPNAVYDSVVVGGNLDFAGLTTLDIVVNGPGSNVNWSDSFWFTDHAGTNGWLLFDVTGTTSNFENITVNALEWLDSEGDTFSSILSYSYFSLYQSGNDLYLNFTYVPIPEPSSLGLMSMGLLLVLRRHRRIAGQKSQILNT